MAVVWPTFWAVEIDESLGWKDARAWHLFCVATDAWGRVRRVEVIVRAGGAASAERRARERMAGRCASLRIVHVREPPTRMRVKDLERVNAWIREKWRKGGRAA